MPVSKSRRSSQFRIENNKEIPFSNAAILLSTDTWTLLEEIYTIAPRSEVQVDKLQADMGVIDDPGDENITFVMAFAPPERTPSSPIPQAFWMTVQSWRAIGAGDTVLDPMQRFDESFEGRMEAIGRNFVDGSGEPIAQGDALCLFARSSTTSSVQGVGLLSITERFWIRIFSDGDHGWGSTTLEDVVTTMWGDP